MLQKIAGLRAWSDKVLVSRTLNRLLQSFPNNDVAWLLSEPQTSEGSSISGWKFRSCKPVDVSGKLSATIKKLGMPTEIAFGAFDIPYVGSKMAEMLRREVGDEIQLIEVNVEDKAESVWILNVLNEERCIDESLSEFERWEVGNPIRPDKAGQYSSFVKLVVDKTATGGHDILRPWGWHQALIVSERLKLLIESVGSESSRFKLA